MDKKNVLNIKFIGNTNKNPSIKLKKYDKRNTRACEKKSVNKY